MKTAIDELIEQFEKRELPADWKKYFKEKEKQQIIRDNRSGVDMIVDKKPWITGEQYYKETYGS